ncbi:hypothetical protein ACNKHP_25100 [Shigella boydii]
MKLVEIATKTGRHVAIRVTSRGPQIRVSTFKEGKVFLNIGDEFLLDAKTWVKVKATKKKSGIDYKGLLLTSCLVTSCCWTMVASS